MGLPGALDSWGSGAPSHEWMISHISLLIRAALVTFLFVLPSYSPAGAPKSKAVATLDAVDLTGKHWNKGAMTARVILIEFWGTWCGGCLKDHADLRELRHRYKESGFEILGLVHDQLSVEDLKAWLSKHEVDWPQVYDAPAEKSHVLAPFKCTYFPSYILIGRSGEVLDVHKGPIRWRNETMLRLLESACRQPVEASRK